MLISEEYRQLNRALHATLGYGRYGDQWANRVAHLVARLQPESILDYGCGKGALKQALGLPIAEYDPAIPGKDELPKPAQFVICTDVLEHIEPNCLDDVLDHLQDLTKSALFAVISTRLAEKVLADGRNAHLIVDPWPVWEARLLKRFRIGEVTVHPTEVEVLLLKKNRLLLAIENRLRALRGKWGRS